MLSSANHVIVSVTWQKLVHIITVISSNVIATNKYTFVLNVGFLHVQVGTISKQIISYHVEYMYTYNLLFVEVMTF